MKAYTVQNVGCRGDPKYLGNGSMQNGALEVVWQLIALTHTTKNAWKLQGLVHPVTGTPAISDCTSPAEFEKIVKRTQNSKCGAEINMVEL